jgi:hypothetical protein
MPLHFRTSAPRSPHANLRLTGFTPQRWALAARGHAITRAFGHRTRRRDTQTSEQRSKTRPTHAARHSKRQRIPRSSPRASDRRPSHLPTHQRAKLTREHPDTNSMVERHKPPYTTPMRDRARCLAPYQTVRAATTTCPPSRTGARASHIAPYNNARPETDAGSAAAVQPAIGRWVVGSSVRRPIGSYVPDGRCRSWRYGGIRAPGSEP